MVQLRVTDQMVFSVLILYNKHIGKNIQKADKYPTLLPISIVIFQEVFDRKFVWVVNYFKFFYHN